MALVEGEGVVAERGVQGLDERRGESIGERERYEAGVVVHDVVGAVGHGGLVDGVERRSDVVGLVDRQLHLVRMGVFEYRPHVCLRARARRREERDVVATARQRRAQHVHHLLHSAVLGWRHGDPWRRDHRDV